MGRAAQTAGFESVAKERERIAQEMHDGIAQSLYGIALQAHLCRIMLPDDTAGATRKLLELENLANDAIREIRYEIFKLRDDHVRDESLSDAIRRFAGQFTELSGVPASLSIRGEEQDVPLEIKRDLIRVIREGLSNVAKHAHASNVAIRVAYEPETIGVTLEDNGVGFDPEAVEKHEGTHMGIKNIKSRAGHLAGTVAIDSAPGSGTALRLSCPMRPLAGTRRM